MKCIRGSNGLRTMIKGTYYPKNTGTHEIIVVKKSNILAFLGMDVYGNGIAQIFLLVESSHLLEVSVNR